MKKYILSFAVLFLAFGCESDDKVTIQQYNRSLDSLKIFYQDYAATKAELQQTHQRLDSVELAVRYILPKLVKHDSIVNNIEFKRDRAYRRGQNVAGIIDYFLPKLNRGK
jgi:hypothetical protein